MKIEDIISVPSDFKKVSDNEIFEEHKNSRGTKIMTWKDTNGQIIRRSKVNKHENGWTFYVSFSKKDIIWFYPVKNRFSLREEKIAICRFSEKSEEQCSAERDK